jgi:hypothetical protein
MTPKLPEILPDVASRFVDATRDFFAEENPHKRDAIAAHQFSILGQYQNLREKPLRLSDVKDMFEENEENSFHGTQSAQHVQSCR